MVAVGAAVVVVPSPIAAALSLSPRSIFSMVNLRESVDVAMSCLKL